MVLEGDLGTSGKWRAKVLKDARRAGSQAEYFYFNIISIIVLFLLLKTYFAFFILIGAGKKCINILVIGFFV